MNDRDFLPFKSVGKKIARYQSLLIIAPANPKNIIQIPFGELGIGRRGRDLQHILFGIDI